MAGAYRMHVGVEPPADQREISHTVHRLVTHEFIGPPQRRIDYAVVVEHDRIRRRRTANQPLRPQPLHLPQEAERAGPPQLESERTPGDTECPALVADQLVRKFYLDVQR